MADRKGAAIWSPEALADLNEIWNYYERVAGRNIVEKIVRKIGDVIVTIEDHPFAGRAREELRPGFRSLAATPHVVFYRVKIMFLKSSVFWIAEGILMRFSLIEKTITLPPAAGSPRRGRTDRADGAAPRRAAT